MAKISINNGNTVTDVANLTDEDVAHALDAGHFDDEIDPVGEGREWLDAYCAAHSGKYGAPFVVG